MRVAFLVAIALLGACSGNQGRAPEASSLDRLRNLTYHGIDVAHGPIALVDGSWEGEPIAGGASRARVSFVRDFHLVGDLDGDGRDEVVVLLGASGGGTGEVLYLALVGWGDDGWRNVATAPVGDRVQVRSARLAAGSIVLDVVQAGPTDALCCPGELVTRSWNPSPAGLEEGPAMPGGRLGLDVLMGPEWVLTRWSWDEPVKEGDPEITLVVQGEHIAGTSGCNRYVATVMGGARPGDWRVGPLAGTRMACAEPASAVESRFRSQLEGVTKFGFVAGQLALSFARENAGGTMLFTGRAPRQE